MDFRLTENQELMRQQVRELCAQFPDEYWREKDEQAQFPYEFHQVFAQGGWLGLTIPPQYGGAGQGLLEAAIVMEEVASSAGAINAATVLHHSVFSLYPFILYGTESAKARYLPAFARGEWHVAIAITEPDAGTNTPRITTRAVRSGDGYRINGQKIFITKVKESRKMLLLARTTPYEEVEKKTYGMTLFLADIDPAAVEVKELRKLGRNAVDTNMLFIHDLFVPLEDRVGEEGTGFYHLMDGFNPERILIAAECVGLGKRAISRAAWYAKNRVVFDRPIGINQGIQFPLSDSYAKLEAAQLLVYKAAWLFDQRQPCGKEANIAKYLAAEAAFEAADRALQVHGGYGYIKETDVERYWREARLFRLAPVSQELALAYIAEHLLGLPRSF